MEHRPKVGVGVIVIKNNKVLLGKRKSAHGEGTWSFPGGHLEFQESWEDCARREVEEETNLKIKNIRFGAVTNDFFENKHYVTILMVTDYDSGDLKTMEPDKCEQWDWFSWDRFPEPLFIPIKNLLKQGFKIT